MVAGPYVNDEHLVVTVVEADKAEKVHQFLSDARLNHGTPSAPCPLSPSRKA
jgi:hypothetical protein